MPTPVMSRKERRPGKHVSSLCFAAAALSRCAHWVRAESSARRTAVVEAVEKVQHCVVSITSEKLASSSSRWPFSPAENRLPLVNGMGSGVLVDGRGYIMTNHHVVDKVQGIVVALVRRNEVPGPRDPESIRSWTWPSSRSTPTTRWPRSKIGTSSDLMVGETVITIGNAFGYENTVSVGNHQCACIAT